MCGYQKETKEATCMIDKQVDGRYSNVSSKPRWENMDWSVVGLSRVRGALVVTLLNPLTVRNASNFTNSSTANASQKDPCICKLKLQI
jgi:hypothetical protein